MALVVVVNAEMHRHPLDKARYISSVSPLPTPGSFRHSRTGGLKQAWLYDSFARKAGRIKALAYLSNPGPLRQVREFLEVAVIRPLGFGKKHQNASRRVQTFYADHFTCIEHQTDTFHNSELQGCIRALAWPSVEGSCLQSTFLEQAPPLKAQVSTYCQRVPCSSLS